MSPASAPQFCIAHFDAKIHHRQAFTCESKPLTDYLHKRARKEMEAKVAACFVLVPLADPSRIAGFYTLSQCTVALDELPSALAKQLPRYPALGATLIGRLARDTTYRGAGVGGLLLTDALRRSVRLSEEAGAVVVVTDPNDPNATAFYTAYGFQPLDDRRLFIPMKDLIAMFATKRFV